MTSDLSGVTLSTVSSELGDSADKYSLSPTGRFPQPGLASGSGLCEGQEERGLQQSSPSLSSFLLYSFRLTLINGLA